MTSDGTLAFTADVAKYDQLRAQGKLNAVDSSSLASEKLEAGRHEERLKACC